MKLATIFILCMLSFSVWADITPPPPNYTKLDTHDEPVDSVGELNDDPEQTVSLNSTEISTVNTTQKQAKTDLKTIWQRRILAAQQRAK